MLRTEEKWEVALICAAGELLTAREQAFTHQIDIDMREWDQLAIRVSKLTIPTATKTIIYPMQGTLELNGYGYDTDLGGNDWGLPVPKADFVVGKGKTLAIIDAKCPYIKLDAVVDVTDAAAEMVVLYHRRRKV